MPINEFFPGRPSSHPMIYAYEDTNPQYEGMLKVGYTSVDVDKRVAQQYPTKRPDGSIPYRIVLRESAMYPDGSHFRDTDVHRVLKKKTVPGMGGEWFKCSVEDVKAAIIAVRNGIDNVENRTQSFSMRPEQADAVKRTMDYFESAEKEGSGRIPKFLWNAKMRFGKTFASYQLAKKMGLSKVLILTFKPAVQKAWREDLMTHIDFEGWQFISRDPNNLKDTLDNQYQRANKNKPIVCFGSFQDFLGVNKATGGIKANNEWVHATNWDLVIFDEYHFGAWKESAKQLFEADEDTYEDDLSKYDRGNAYDETWLPITTRYYLYLSGTPFRALNSGEFIEEQIYNWTYSDEQRAKDNWVGEDNPYEALPRMVMLTYKIPDSIQQIAKQGEFDEFDLNVFFSTEGEGEDAHFKYEDYVQKWLDLIRGSYLATSVDELKQGAEKPPMPFSDVRLLNVLSHTLWFLPKVSSCYAMYNLLRQRQNSFFDDYEIIVCAGTQAGIGVKALEPVQKAMKDPLSSKTITLSCGKLMTGVTVKPWTGILMLCNLKSPETYFQAAFRVQSPWEVTDDSGKKKIIKRECYVFDFALDRALKQISDYSCRLSVDESNPEKKVGEFINFLPVLAYDGSSMRQVDAAEILDIAMAGTSATLLAKRWESALLVNVDNDTLRRLMNNKEAMEALMKIEGFRSLNSEIETIINKSESVKKAKKENSDMTPKEKKEISEEEKEYKSLRKKIQEKLIKFATRVPVFMYLTDYREYSLKDVITQLEPDLFRKVTGLNVKDFELLVSLNVFNESLMNDAVYKFKRYEDASLIYAGVDRHAGENIGLFSTVISREDYDKMSGILTESMSVSDDFYVGMAMPTDVVVENSDDDELDFTVEVPPKKDDKSSKRKPIVAEHVPMESLAPTYRPSYTPPTAANPQEKKKSVVEVDVSKVKVGSKVHHKAFGDGEIVSLDDDSISVMFYDFDNRIKPFNFPGAFLDNYLTLI